MTSTTQTSEEAETAVRSKRLVEIETELAGHSHRRVPRELRRRHLLELATQLFSEKGYAAASMDELAAHAGVSKPVVYDQFGSKEGVLVAVIDDLGEDLSRTVIEVSAGRTDPEELLREGSLAFYRFVGERASTWAMAFGAVRALDTSSLAAAEKVAEIRARQDGLVAGVLLASAKALGTEVAPLELSAVTRGLNGVYEGMVEWWQDHPDVSAEQLTEWTVALVLPGLTAMAEGRA